MTDVGGAKMSHQEEADQVRRSWYVAPKPPAPRGWLVFSDEFVLRILQGQYVKQVSPKRTLVWQVAAFVAMAVIAVMQFGLMFLSLMPLSNSVVEMLAVHLKRGRFGFFLRSCYWKTRLRSLGQDTLIERGLEIWGARNIDIGSGCHLDTNVRLAAGEERYGQGGHLSIGDFCHIGPRCHIAARGGVDIGDFVSIEAGVHVYSATNTLIHADHPGQLVSFSHTAPYDLQHTMEAPVSIQDYAMVGFNSIVMPGASIGLGALVHPHTQVIGTYPAFANIIGPGRSRQNGWRRPPRMDPRLVEARHEDGAVRVEG